MRDPVLAEFLAGLVDAIRLQPNEPAAVAAVDRIEAALRTPAPAGNTPPQRLPVCDHLPAAYAIATADTPAVARVAEALAALEPGLAWRPRHAGGPHASANWPEGHANATIVGRGGLEERADMLIGASLLAPHVRYPDHNPGPEEVYLLLTPGRFAHGTPDWFEPGIGGTLYNVPNIRHAMASDAVPLLALWCLWMGEAA